MIKRPLSVIMSRNVEVNSKIEIARASLPERTVSSPIYALERYCPRHLGFSPKYREIKKGEEYISQVVFPGEMVVAEHTHRLRKYAKEKAVVKALAFLKNNDEFIVSCIGDQA